MVPIGSATTTRSGSYSIGGLADGVYTVQAFSPGFVPQIQKGVTVVSAASVTVNLALNVGIAIHAPISGVVINDFSVLVTGEFDTTMAPEVGINVNGFLALQDGNEFATFVPMDSTTTTLIATVTGTGGTPLGSHTIPITVQPQTSEPALNFRPSPVIGAAPLTARFNLTSLNAIANIAFDANGDGTVDFNLPSLEGQTFVYNSPGLYHPKVIVTDTIGGTHTANAIIQVIDTVGLDTLLQSKWNGMRDALRSGNIVGAVNYIVNSKRASYQAVFNNLTVPLATIDQVLPGIAFVEQRGLNVEYEMLRLDGANLVSYMVVFVVDEDGVWRIKFI